MANIGSVTDSSKIPKMGDCLAEEGVIAKLIHG